MKTIIKTLVKPTKDRVNSQREAKKGFEQAQNSVAAQAEKNKARREKNKKEGRKSSRKSPNRSTPGARW